MAVLKTAETKQLGPKKAALNFIFFTILIDFLGYGIIAPLYAFYVLQFSTSAFIIGLLATSYALMQFIFSPILGALSDRFGRRPILLLSQLGAAIGYILFATSDQLWLLFVSRMIAGLTAGNISTAQAYIADVTSIENRSKGFAIFGAASGLGIVLGPLIAVVAVKHSLALPSLIAAGFALLNLIYGLFVLPESHVKRTARSLTIFNPIKTLVKYLSMPRVNIITLAIFMMYLCYLSIQTILALFAVDRFGYGPSQVAYILTYVGFLSVVFQIGLHKVINKFPEYKLGVSAFVIIVMGYLGTSFSYDLWMLIISLTVTSLGNAIVQTILLGRLSKLAPESEQGSIMGASQSMNSLAAIIGPILGGLLYQYFGAGAPYLGAVVFALIALSCFTFSFNKVGQTSTNQKMI
ncbi:MFS transporter [Paenibacillus sp. NPDC056933]|uniref:MFS transporter n=1 Tax=Paenibacillus sp. NPDC056933 TaxID=3345968 RepID=UPI003640C5C5